jgi:hypothetical protein
MKNLLTWLKQKLSRNDYDDDPYSRRQAVRVSAIPRPRKKPAPPKKVEKAQKLEDFEYSADGPGQIDDGGPGKNVLVQNRYLREDTGTHETLKIVDDSISESEEPPEFDPYNTGRFDRSRSWDAPSRKK